MKLIFKTMFKLFNTLEEFNQKNFELDSILGYPTNDNSIITYSKPIETKNGFAMQILQDVVQYFNESELVENIELIELVENIE